MSRSYDVTNEKPLDVKELYAYNNQSKGNVKDMVSKRNVNKELQVEERRSRSTER